MQAWWVGLIRAITVKERSSSKRKELFRSIQRQANINPQNNSWSTCRCAGHQLIWCWIERRSISNLSTSCLWDRRDEKDLVKRAKLDNLKLTEEEWGRAKLFLDLLTHADRAQQAFSSDQGPSLHLGLPALEALHKAWSSRIERPKYADFKEPLRAAVKRLKTTMIIWLTRRHTSWLMRMYFS